jgi:TetR/AcrR family transcriptional regulator, tetracycline repressor protein
MTTTQRATQSGRLTRERIVAAATDLLESNGADGVTTRTIGEALDVHPTALYRHFRDMDELLREAADGILAGVAAPTSTEGGVDTLDAAALLCHRIRSVLLAHPGAARVVATGPSRMTNERAITERLLGLLGESRLPEAEVTLAYHALIEFTVGSAAVDAAYLGESHEEEEARHRGWRADYFAASPTDFPQTTRFAAELYPAMDEQFRYGLDLIVSGLRQRVGTN